MSVCIGNGDCLQQCECDCYDEKTGRYNKVCTCGHRQHGGYCPSDCCVPVECPNYKKCGEKCDGKLPQWVLDCNNGHCMNCAIQLHAQKTNDAKRETDLYEMSRMIKIAVDNHTPKNDIRWINHGLYCRYAGAINRYYSACEAKVSKEFREVDVEVMWGGDEDIMLNRAREYDAKSFIINKYDKFPLDKYDGQKTIIFVNFRGKISQPEMRSILGGYQYIVNIRRSHRYARWTKVFIISSVDPNTWYKEPLSEGLLRRITSITEYKIE